MTAPEIRTWHVGVLLIGIVLFATLFIGDPKSLAEVAREDGLIENFTALFYVFGAAASLFAIYCRKTILFASVWLALCILFLGEETSWFQRLFDYHVPTVEGNSGQNEFNLHNQLFWHGRKWIDANGEFNFSLHKLLGAQAVFRIGFAFYFLVLPILLMSDRIGNLADKIKLPRIPTGFVISIWIVIFGSFVLALTTEPPLKDWIAEAREFFYAIVIFIYTLSFRHQIWDARPLRTVYSNA